MVQYMHELRWVGNKGRRGGLEYFQKYHTIDGTSFTVFLYLLYLAVRAPNGVFFIVLFQVR